MKHLATHERRAFLKDHPPVMERKLIASTGEETTYLAATVLGVNDDDKHEPWTAECESVSCILAEDVLVPAEGDVWALAYVHAAFIASELVWAEGVSATDQKEALAEMRAIGLYGSEA
jgi:hypothetical protein